jgi:uncharacterized protein with PQ loop repeat
MQELIHQASGILMTICYLFCNVPQIIKIVKTKSAKDISIGFLGLATAGHIFATIYGSFGSNNIWTFVCYGGGLISSLVLLVLWNKYGKA